MAHPSKTTLVELANSEIISAGFFDDEEFKNIPTLVIRLSTGRVKTLMIMTDAEGNGTGWIHIYDISLAEDECVADTSQTVLTDLKDGKIISAGFDDFDEFKNIPTLVVQTSTGETKALLVMSDPEGNGAGHLDILNIHLVQDVIHPYGKAVAPQPLQSEGYQYLDISGIKNVSQLKKLLSVGDFIEQTRFFPKAEFVHLCVRQMTTKEIRFIRINDNQQSFFPWSPASQWVFEEKLISVWDDRQPQPVHLFDLRPIARGDMDLADWLEFLYQVRQEKSLLVHTPANDPAGKTQGET